MNWTKLLTIFFIYQTVSWAKVDPPNYNFSLDQFELFMPGKTLDEISKQFPQKELLINEDNFKTYKFYVEHIRYKFAILVQFNKGIVTDFHARLPSYFLHDIFHQSLINRYGPQTSYKRKEEQAVYHWKEIKGNEHLYMGTCTITCFPVYYSVKTKNLKGAGEFKSIIQRLNQ